MSLEEREEFIIMLLIEQKINTDTKLYDYFIKRADRITFNKRYRELLDKFLNKYALNKTEKSDGTN